MSIWKNFATQDENEHILQQTILFTAITIFNLSTFSHVSVLDIPFDFRSKHFSEIMFEKFTPLLAMAKERETDFAELIYVTVANHYDSNGSVCLCVTTLQRSSYLVILKV